MINLRLIYLPEAGLILKIKAYSVVPKIKAFVFLFSCFSNSTTTHKAFFSHFSFPLYCLMPPHPHARNHHTVVHIHEVQETFVKVVDIISLSFPWSL